MKYILEITKIIDGAIRADREKVSAYTKQIARKLSETGEESASKRILACLQPHERKSELAANDFGPPARLPVDGESRLHLADEIQPSPEPVYVSLPPRNQDTINQFLRYVNAADRLLAGGVGISPSMILYGPPGCGKTVLAHHIASQLGLPMLVARSDSLISSYLGSTSKNIRSLFEHASNHPTVLFLDEFDAFAKLRDDPHELGELKRVVVSLLQNIDALDGRTVLLAASNHDHLLDPAVWRRFAYRLNMQLPTLQQRIDLFEHFLGSYAQSESLQLFAQISDTLTGAQIRHLCDDAIRESILSDNQPLDEAFVLMRIAWIKLGADNNFDMDCSAELARQLHSLDQQVFNGKRIATILDKSQGTISRWLRG